MTTGLDHNSPIKKQITLQTGELLGLQEDLTSNMKQFKVYKEALAPGRRASRTHYHTQKEEFIFVLKGDLVLYHANKEIHLAAGMSACLPPGQDHSHVLMNKSSAVAEVLLVFPQVSDDDIVYQD
jgi:uncharacterized cupin superfamily protein